MLKYWTSTSVTLKNLSYWTILLHFHAFKEAGSSYTIKPQPWSCWPQPHYSRLFLVQLYTSTAKEDGWSSFGRCKLQRLECRSVFFSWFTPVLQCSTAGLGLKCRSHYWKDFFLVLASQSKLTGNYYLISWRGAVNMTFLTSAIVAKSNQIERKNKSSWPKYSLKKNIYILFTFYLNGVCPNRMELGKWKGCFCFSVIDVILLCFSDLSFIQLLLWNMVIVLRERRQY